MRTSLVWNLVANCSYLARLKPFNFWSSQYITIMHISFEYDAGTLCNTLANYDSFTCIYEYKIKDIVTLKNLRHLQYYYSASNDNG